MGRPAGSFTVALGSELRERLLAAARERGITPSAISRRAIFEALRDKASVAGTPLPTGRRGEAMKELRVRVPEGVAALLAASACAVGMTQAAYLSAVVAEIADRLELRVPKGRALEIEAAGTLREAIVGSNATLAQIGRNLNQIARTLNANPKLMSAEDRRSLAEIARQVAQHLEIASDLLRAIRSPRMAIRPLGIAPTPGREP